MQQYLQTRPSSRALFIMRPRVPWRQARERVREAADWLFKVIGAASAVLSDPAARRKLDMDLQREAVISAAYPPTRCAGPATGVLQG